VGESPSQGSTIQIWISSTCSVAIVASIARMRAARRYCYAARPNSSYRERARIPT
jgi:hypothetical protein